MNIAIFTGGDSSEYVISMKSAKQVLKWLDAAGHTCYLVEVRKDKWSVHLGKKKVALDKNSFSFLNNEEKITFDFIWNTIHGTPGEDGKMQGFFDIMGIPYSCSNQFSSALTFNKYTCKSFLKQHNVLTPESSLVRKNLETDLEAVAEMVGFPCFVKPNSGGSSFGIAKVVRFEDLKSALEEALEEDDEAIVERYIKGTEVTCGLMKNREGITVFPLTEIITENEFFDYEAKYTVGKAQEITPARIDDDVSKKCQDMALDIYKLCNSTGIIRVDFIIKGNQVYFLELNSIPGMTEESIIPKQVHNMGLEMPTVLQQVIDEVLGA
ncbi:MAG: D-alanine--D-alanine ligase [Bacteroidetes bacterium]|nr:MAG: D-alanine--D-alanine ligase [Bacteroidota bacterium]RLD72183.1 MAG: D-alanine--D-alanine ligase [Bacteroidota bacterium]RLD93985.1 MAG: D-alanine--D-alanine ligase [Bacteroidota bacterium]